jgi:hypothetical protein
MEIENPSGLPLRDNLSKLSRRRLIQGSGLFEQDFESEWLSEVLVLGLWRVDVEAVFVVRGDFDESHPEEVRGLPHGEVRGLRGHDLLSAGRVPRHPEGDDVSLGGPGDGEPAEVLPVEEVREEPQDLPLEPPDAFVNSQGSRRFASRNLEWARRALGSGSVHMFPRTFPSRKWRSSPEAR